jgi:hypothetical protein
MKNHNLKKSKNIHILFKIFLSTAISLSINNKAISQNKNSKFGVSISNSLSGDGFGAIYSPSSYFKNKNYQIGFGLNIQKHNLHVSGAQINFDYALYNESKGSLSGNSAGDLELFSFSIIRYNSNAFLSAAQISRERKINPESNLPLDKLKFSAVEAYAGFGLKLSLAKRIKWGNSIGIGGWKTLTGKNSLYRDYNSLSLILNTSLSFDLY